MTDDARLEALLGEVIATQREHMERFERYARETETLQRRMAESQATYFRMHYTMMAIAALVTVVVLLFALSH